MEAPTGSPELRTPYWGEGTHYDDGTTRPHRSYLSTVYFPFIQAAPAVEYEEIGTHQNTANTSNWSRSVGSGLANIPKISDRFLRHRDLHANGPAWRWGGMTGSR